MKAIIDILYLEEYKLLLLLNNGQEQVVNLEETLNTPELSSLKEKKIFTKFAMTDGKIAWPNGKDIPSDFLLEILETEEKVAA